MGWWNAQVVPRLVDKMGDPPELRAERQRACARLAGDVLEIGFGSGLNLPYYPGAVTSLTAVEPSAVARKLAAQRLAAATIPVTFTGDDAESLPFPDDRFDAALSTLTLCTIPDPATAIAEVHRVLKPGGGFFFCEHGLAPDASVQRWQRRWEPLQRRMLGGCHLTRAIPDLLARSDFVLDTIEDSYLLGPAVSRPFSYTYRGSARKPA